MWFMIKGAFWFSLVLLALPFFNGESEVPADPGAEVAVTDGLSVAFAALADIRQMCERNAVICEKGGEALHALGLRARDGARIAYELLNENLGGAETATPPLADYDPIETAAVEVPSPAPLAAPIAAPVAEDAPLPDHIPVPTIIR